MRTSAFDSVVKALQPVMSSACYACLLLATAAASAAPTIDALYGNNGIARVSAGLPFHNFGTPYTLPSGGVVAAGWTSESETNARLVKHFVARLTPNGQPDPAFGTAGGVLLDDFLRCIGRSRAAVQPDGAIAVLVDAGISLVDPTCPPVPVRQSFRLDASGKPIQGFAPAFALPDRPNAQDALIARPDGRLVHATVLSNSSALPHTVVVDQALPDGQPDSQFGANGRTVLDIPGDGSSGTVTLALLPDHALLVVVLATNGLHVYKLDALGRLVPEFGTAGVFTLAGEFSHVPCCARAGIAILSDASLYLQFDATTASDNDWIFKALRLSPTGTLRSTLTLPPGTFPWTPFAVLADDSIVFPVAHFSENRSTLRRLLPDDTLDATFGPDGGFEVPGMHISDLALDLDGRLIVYGNPGSNRALFSRLNMNNVMTLARVVEYYHASLDHYFITWLRREIAALDAGTATKGWMRTGKTFNAYILVQPESSPICRYYIPPALGNSHFFGRGTDECSATGAAHPSFVREDPAFMHMILPEAGACPANTIPVYRVFSNRPDANHRYTTDRAVRDEMVAKGWVAEGEGADRVVMCAPAG